MAVKDYKRIDDRLKELYANQVTSTANTQNYEDRSYVLFAQMKFIAMTNKRALNLT